jgi:hypothetical protein
MHERVFASSPACLIRLGRLKHPTRFMVVYHTRVIISKQIQKVSKHMAFSAQSWFSPFLYACVDDFGNILALLSDGDGGTYEPGG